MKILIILGHPNQKSFNHAIAKRVQDTLLDNGCQVIFHDLYAEGFPPLITAEEILKEAPADKEIAQHCQDLHSADGIIVVHPNWWGQPPAILKGWVDRVFRPGIAYRFNEGDPGAGVPAGLLRAHTAVIFNTSDTPYERELVVFGDPLERLWKNNFGFCGVKKVVRKTFRVIVTSTAKQRQNWLDEAGEIVNCHFKE